MAAIDHWGRPWMQADGISEIFRSFSGIVQNQFVDISTSAAEQSDNINRSAVSETCVEGQRGILTSPLAPVCLDCRRFQIRGLHFLAQEIKLPLHLLH